MKNEWQFIVITRPLRDFRCFPKLHDHWKLAVRENDDERSKIKVSDTY